MAVYTDLTDEELEALLSRYDIGAARSFKGIAEGVENSNFLLDTSAGRYILTVFERRVERADLPFFMAVMAALGAEGFPAPKPMRLRAGGLLAEVRGKPAAIVTFLQGVSPRRPNAAQCRAIGAAMARMHLILQALPVRRDNALSVAAWGPMIRPRLPFAESLRPGLAGAVEAGLARLEAAWPQGLPQGVIHADLFPDNALFLGDALGGVIDFYFACTDALAYDIAVCLNAWCFEPDRSFNLTKGQNLLAGYCGVRPLTEAETAALPVLAHGAAMRFFATRLIDWAETPANALVRPKDPLEYADKLAFHARVDSPAAYGA